MKRIKKHKLKTEKPETSTSYRQVEEYDLTYYIHDRVELMHQVFSMLKPKELKAIAPECVRQLSIDNLQELCTEELLGISSKRLCAILDGVEAPSDTESSSESLEHLETISLDSISSDEEILSQTSSRKHKKHKRHHRKPKPKKAPESDAAAPETEQSRASRAGLTVLELLELQARARAIRAQLQREQANKQQAESESAAAARSTDDEVQIKEEPAEVVEISSEDEKPSVQELSEKISNDKETIESTNDSQTVTKRVNDLVITVPQVKQSRKIKLNRSKITVSVANNEKTVTTNKTVTISTNDKPTTSKSKETSEVVKKTKEQDKQKKKIKKKGKKKAADKDSDHDEITLQLSDTEKMDLLEDLDRKNYEKLSSSGSEDTESSSSDSESQSNSKDEEKNSKDKNLKQSDLQKELDTITEIIDKNKKIPTVSDTSNGVDEEVTEVIENDLKQLVITKISGNVDEDVIKKTNNVDNTIELEETSQEKSDTISGVIEIASSSQEHSTDNDATQSSQNDETEQTEAVEKRQKSPEMCVEITAVNDLPVVEDEKQNEDRTKSPNKAVTQETKNDKDDKEMSDGEVSDRASSEIEAFELKAEVVCISDEETDKKAKKKKKEKKKKSKSKKSKKSKSDFQESSDQNFYEDAVTLVVSKDNSRIDTTETLDGENEKPDSIKSVYVVDDDCRLEKHEIEEKTDDATISVDDDDYEEVCEIFELSDNSSCYEVEGTMLSKEPTAEEIEALSAKIDEIEREDVITEEEIREHERRNMENNDDSGNVEDISWKDRYLDSKKVKRVLTTSNIFNALRRKNRELKMKLQVSKIQELEKEAEIEKPVEVALILEEGSIEHFNMLQGSKKYVNPVQEPLVKADELEKDSVESRESSKNEPKTNENTDEFESTEALIETQTPQAVKEMRKDAKQLLKMYKKLLKYNDISKQKDPNKKKKKKTKKKNKDKLTTVSTAGST